MATYYVNGTSGDDSNDGTSAMAAKATVQAAIDASSDNDTVSVANGTYSENVTLNKDITLQSTSGTYVGTIITASSAGKTITVTSAGDGATIKNLTIIYASTQNSTTSNAGAILSDSNGSGAITVEGCSIVSNTCGIGYLASGTVVNRCRLTGTGVQGNATKAKGSNYGVVAYNYSITVTACLLTDWGAAGIYLDHNDSVAKSCTVVSTGNYDTYFQGAIWSTGESSGGPTVANCIAFNAHGTNDQGMRFGFQHSSNSHEGLFSNCLTYDSGSNRDMGDNTGTSASSAKHEYWRMDAATTTNLYGGDYDGNGSVDNSYGDNIVNANPIFVDHTIANYTPHSDGSAYGNGIASLTASLDLSGSAFNSSPSIGCFEGAASGWSGGTHVAGVAAGSCTSVVGVAVGSIASIKGV